MPPVEFERVQSWTELNPTYRYELLTNARADSFVTENFGPHASQPDARIYATWRALESQILRADYLRYLIIWVHGGLYTDIDTKCTRAIDQWIDNDNINQTGMVIGVEIDSRDNPEENLQWAHPYGFVQWSFLARPRHPALRMAIDLATQRLHEEAIVQNCTLAGLTFNMKILLRMSGPGVFTDAVLAYLADSDPTDKEHKSMDWTEFEHLTEPKRMKDVLVLPINAFASGQAHSRSEPQESAHTYLTHAYQFSWEAERW